MSDSNHHDLSFDEGHWRERVSSRRQVSRLGAVGPGGGRWLWVVGVVTIAGVLAAFLMRTEASPADYVLGSLLLSSLGLLAFVSAGRALSMGYRYEESVLHVEEIEESYLSLRQVFCTALDERDHVTGGHSERVAGLSVELGRHVGLSQQRLRHLERAAFLHDIGKVRVSDSILIKPGPLDSQEWDEMQQHPYYSYSILKQVDSLRESAEIVYCHHERFDGMGYPRGLGGSEIPLEARVFAVVDAYDAMISQRPYRDPLSHEQAVREILSHSGTQFDPQVVSVFAAWALRLEEGGAVESGWVAPSLDASPPRLIGR